MRAALVVLATCSVACRVEWGVPNTASTTEKPAGEVLVYTSMYRHVVDALDVAMREDLPAIKPSWYQAGSEKVASRLDSELAAGACPADLLMTSDPAHYARLKDEGRLMPQGLLGALRVPRALVDPDGAFVTVRVSTMVLAYRNDVVTAPQKLADLWSPALRGEAIVGDPLASGTYFTSLAILELVHGPGFFPSLRAGNVVATGGNSAVQEKLLNGEKKAGMILLENVLTAQKAGQPLTWKLPDDGVILVPGPMAMLKTAPHPSAAHVVMEWMLGERAQRIIVEQGLMHAAREGVPPPAGVPSLEALMGTALKLDPATWTRLSHDGAEVKARFGAAYGR